MEKIKFKWKGIRDRKEVSGDIEAFSREEAEGRLRQEQIKPTEIKKAGGFSMDMDITIGTGVGTADVVVFTRQFSTMINAGLPILSCLDILGNQLENKFLAKRLKQIASDVEEGSTLSDSLGKHKDIFDSLYIHMVEAGEIGGILDTILERLADYMEKNAKILAKIKGAMVYPMVVIGVSSVAIAILLIFVIPTFAAMFSGMGAELPGPTQTVLVASHILIGYWWLIILTIVGIIVGIKQWHKTDAGEKVLDMVLLKLPVLGNLQRKTAVARFTRTLGTLLGSGVPILDALEITAKTAGNRIVTDAVLDTRTSISKGETISKPLSKHEFIFPPMVVSMIAIGEETGALEDMLVRIANFYDDEVDQAVETLTAAMEPIMIVGLGITIGYIVVAMYMPMFKLISAMEN
ncbi:MAG: pilus assembly protein PilC [Candidatus Cloacimonetes bacterium 4572_55]|nr:MAG: pilus assembly protein PilC [Candidatus Cloacimonetes bacterium 4572_55]